MNTIFFFACFALVADDWTIETKDEPSTPDDSPSVIGFFQTVEQAIGHAKTLEGARLAAHEQDAARWRSRLEMTKRSYFVIAVNDLKARKGQGLCQLEDNLISAARLMAQGIGGGALELDEIS